MKRRPEPAIRAPSSAMPAFAGALVACAYLVGAVVFSVASKTPAPDAGPGAPAQTVVAQVRPGFVETALSHVSLGSAAFADPLPEPVAVGDRPVVALTGTGEAASPAALPADPAGPQIAVVIDDVGLDVAAARRALALDTGITVAILPYAPAATQISGEAAAAGHDVLLHMPMEPVGLADPGPNALRIALSDADLAARVRWAMAQVPDAVGLNNHMGSRFTADPRAMRVALSAVSDGNPLFLDSVTTAHSRGRAVAAGLGLRALERDIFLDHEIDAEAISARLAEAETLARDRGWAVVIGHPHGETLDVLEAWIGEAQARGVELVTVSQLAARLSVRNVATADASGSAGVR